MPHISMNSEELHVDFALILHIVEDNSIVNHVTRLHFNDYKRIMRYDQ